MDNRLSILFRLLIFIALVLTLLYFKIQIREISNALFPSKLELKDQPNRNIVTVENIKRNYSTLSKHVKQKRLPDAIIIGVQKGGTRALINFLGINPHIRISRDEIHFFEQQKYTKGLEWYRKQMPSAYPDDIVMEKTPAYIRSKEAPERIKEMNKDIKLIAIFRDPVERLISAWVHFQRVPSFRKMYGTNIEDYLAFKNGSIKISEFVTNGIYSKQLQNYYKYFSNDQILLLDSHKFTGDPLQTLIKVERFLGLTTHVIEKQITYDKKKGFYCQKITKKKVRCLGERKGAPHPKVNKEILDQLYDYYGPFNEELFRITGKRFSFLDKRFV